MRKIMSIILFTLFFFIFIDKVYADSTLELFCDKTSLNEGEKMNCSLKLNTSEVGINSISFDIRGGAFKLSGNLGSDATPSGFYYSSNKAFQNNDMVVSFDVMAPARMTTLDLPIRIVNLKIKKDETIVNQQDKLTPVIRVNGSILTKDVKPTIELDCHVYIGIDNICNVVFNAGNSYYNSITFTSSSEFTFDESKYSDYKVEDNTYSLSHHPYEPFVGKTVIGTVSLEGKKDTGILKFTNIKASNSYSATDNGVVGDVNEGTTNISDVTITYESDEIETGLKSLSVDGVSVPDFDTNNTSYEITVNDKKSIKIDAEALDPVNSTIEGLGEFNLKEGINNFVVNYKVKDNGYSISYNLNINNIVSGETKETSTETEGEYHVGIVEAVGVFAVGAVVFGIALFNRSFKKED